LSYTDSVDRTIVSSLVCTKQQNVTEGQTDRQTDRSYVAITAVGIASNAHTL